MRLAYRPQPAKAEPHRSARLVAALALVLVGLQLPWGSAAYVRPLAVAAALVSSFAIAHAWGERRGASPGATATRRRLLRIGQAPLLVCGLWVLVAEAYRGTGVGLGMALGVAGAILAFNVPVKRLARVGLEAGVASAAVLAAMGGLLALIGVFGGAAIVQQTEAVAHVNNPMFYVWLLPALGAIGFSYATRHWHLCSPAKLRQQCWVAGARGVAAFSGCWAIAAGVSLLTDGFSTGTTVQLAVAFVTTVAAVVLSEGYLDLGALLGRGRAVATIAHGWLGWVSDAIKRLRDYLPGATRQSRPSHRSTWPGAPFSAPPQPPFAAGGTTAAPEFLDVPDLAAAPARRPVGNTTTQLAVKAVGANRAIPVGAGLAVVPLDRPKWTPSQAGDPATHPDLLTRIANEAPHLRPQVARNPMADPELLHWLSQLEDPDVALALASR